MAPCVTCRWSIRDKRADRESAERLSAAGRPVKAIDDVGDLGSPTSSIANRYRAKFDFLAVDGLALDVCATAGVRLVQPGDETILTG